MAIIIQENPNKDLLTSFVIGVLVLIGGTFLAYYLFFSSVPAAEDPVRPDGYQDVSLFAQASLDIDSILNSSAWNLLQKDSLISPLVTQIITPNKKFFQSFQER